VRARLGCGAKEVVEGGRGGGGNVDRRTPGVLWGLGYTYEKEEKEKKKEQQKAGPENYPFFKHAWVLDFPMSDLKTRS
jgi:hypothetical protein